MGYNTTLVVMNDALGDIEKDPRFGFNLVAAVHQVSRGKPVDVSAGSHCNAATVIETHHADQTSIVAVGGNYGSVLGSVWGWSHHERDKQEDILRKLAAGFGYVLHRKPAR